MRRFDSLVGRVVGGYRLRPADALDARQATWLAALECGGPRDPARLPGWLAVTASRTALRAARRCRAPGTRPAGAGPLLAEPAADPAEGPEARLLAAEDAATLWRCLGRLPAPSRRLLLLLAHSPELSRAELAAALGISEAALDKRRQRALARLRRALAAER